MTSFKTISPVDGSVYVERSQASDAEIAAALARAVAAEREWHRFPLGERARLMTAFVDAFVSADSSPRR